MLEAPTVANDNTEMHIMASSDDDICQDKVELNTNISIGALSDQPVSHPRHLWES